MASSRILVVYYSRSGATRTVARYLADLLGCDVEEIVEAGSRQGFRGFIRSIFEASRHHEAVPIIPAQRDPGTYDLVMIGTPVWAWTLSSPVRSYIEANHTRLPDVAFFCTKRGVGSENTFTQMGELIGDDPRACVSLTRAEVLSGRYRDKLAGFLDAVRHADVHAMAA